MRIAETVTFGGSGLDRAADLRASAGAAAAAPGAAILPLWQGKPLVREAGAGLALAPVVPGHDILAHAGEAPVLLGRSGGRVWFAQDISGWVPQDGETVSPDQTKPYGCSVKYAGKGKGRKRSG